MKIMPTRMEMLLSSIDAYRETGIFFLLKKDNTYSGLWGGDDLGLYYFIVRLSGFFNYDLDIALKTFFSVILIISWFLGVYFFAFNKKIGFIKKAYVLISLTILVISSYKIGDVYILYTVAPLFLIPLFLINVHKNKSYIFGVFILIGILIGYSNLIRAHSGSLVTLFVIVYLSTDKHNKTLNKVFCLALIILGMLIPKFHFDYLLKQRDIFLKDMEITSTVAQKHVFWHNAFLGLGFINNKFGIHPNDICAENFVKNRNPEIKYFSFEYEEVLKKEFLNFVLKHPGYVLTNYSAKFGVILMFLLMSFNIGLYYIFKNKDRLLIPFSASLLWGVLPGLIFLPYNSYLLGGICVAVLMSNYYINKGYLKCAE